MTIISSHTLNGLNGSHAGSIPVSLKKINESKNIFDTFMDDGGRLNEHVPIENIDENAIYELVFKTGNYWKNIINDENYQNIIQEIVIRFNIPDKKKKYHFPIILSPHSYSTWWSEGE